MTAAYVVTINALTGFEWDEAKTQRRIHLSNLLEGFANPDVMDIKVLPAAPRLTALFAVVIIVTCCVVTRTALTGRW